MTKKQILAELKHNVYCRLGQTSNGIGVVAIKKIAQGTDPFKNCMPNTVFITLSPAEVDDLDAAVKQMVIDFCPLQHGKYYLPNTGLNSIDKSYYLNHSHTPNMITKDDGENFTASRDIEVGEELTADYNTYDEQAEYFKKL